MKKETSQIYGIESQAGYWDLNRDVHNKAYEALSCYLRETVIKNKKYCCLQI